MNDLPTVTCDEAGFMEASIVYAYDRRSVALMGDRVRVDNRQGVREGEVRGVDMFTLSGRPVRRLQIYLDPRARR
jgi:hypothetical protein